MQFQFRFLLMKTKSMYLSELILLNTQKVINMQQAKLVLNKKYSKVLEDEQQEFLRVYDAKSPEEVVKYLYDNNIIVNELKTDKIGLEEYYINLMKTKEVK